MLTSTYDGVMKLNKYLTIGTSWYLKQMPQLFSSGLYVSNMENVT